MLGVPAAPANALVYVPSENVFVLTGDVRRFEETFENVINSVRHDTRMLECYTLMLPLDVYI